MRIATLAVLVLLAACSGATHDETARETPAPPYNADVDVIEVMVHVTEPAARAFWAGWGLTYDDAGLHDVSASTDEAWKKVEDGATTLVVAANTLMLPAYQRKPEDAWLKYAKSMSDLAMLGREGADRQDKAAMEKIGAELDDACDACHKAFRKE